MAPASIKSVLSWYSLTLSHCLSVAFLSWFREVFEWFRAKVWSAESRPNDKQRVVPSAHFKSFSFFSKGLKGSEPRGPFWPWVTLSQVWKRLLTRKNAFVKWASFSIKSTIFSCVKRYHFQWSFWVVKFLSIGWPRAMEPQHSSFAALMTPGWGQKTIRFRWSLFKRPHDDECSGQSALAIELGRFALKAVGAEWIWTLKALTVRLEAAQQPITLLEFWP